MHKLFGVAPEEVQPSEVPGLYQINHKHDLGYVTADGKFLIHGDVTAVDTGEEFTEEHRRADRLAAINAVGTDNMIVFAPPPPLASKYVVTVFTDVDCGYCRKLHSELASYTSKGIEIRYMFWPRSGPDTPSWYRAEAVWCSPDRKVALTEAKKGANVPISSKKACDNPVAKEYELGLQLGVRGTPFLILPSGEMLDGLVPPDWLAQHMAEAETAAVEPATKRD
jgi:thiol:disulfide interchange protein DsbC